MMVRSGKCCLAASASAIPSISGMRISVSSRSKWPCSAIRMSSASAPSPAVRQSCPSMARPRATSERRLSSSSTTRMRDIASDPWQAGLVGGLDHANIGQLAIGMGDVHAVADDEVIGTFEADIVRFDVDGALGRLLQQHGGRYARGAARGEQVLGEGERAAGFKDVVDEQDMAAADVALHVPEYLDLAGGD